MSEPSNGWLLAIDTSTEQASIALYDGQQLSELSWHAGRDQTVSLLDEIDHLLTLTKISISDLKAAGIANGPGMFNGLRVGMSIAKGLALAANLPVIGISTVAAVALPHVACGLPVIAVLAAGRGRLLWATFAPDLAAEPRNGTVEELLEQVDASGIDVLVCGELSKPQQKILARSVHVRMPPLPGAMRRASAVAELAWRRYLDGSFDDPVNLEPVYLHAASPTGNAAKVAQG